MREYFTRLFSPLRSYVTRRVTVSLVLSFYYQNRNWPYYTCIPLLLLLATTRASSAVDYVSFDDAMRLAFPHAGKIERFKPQVSDEQQKNILTRSRSTAQAALGGIYIGHSAGKLDGIAFVDHVIGRTEYITWLCVLNPDGSIRRMDVMSYREPYGGEIRDRRFLDQFIGKNHASRLLVDRDISNIGGATLSVHALTERARFFVHFYELALHEAIPTWLNGRDSPAARNTTQAVPFTRALPLGNSSLTVRVTGEQQDLSGRIDAAILTSEQLNKQLNAWENDSELAAINQRRSATISPALISALQLARSGYDLSGGRFDPTIYPLLQLWSQAEKNGREPIPEQLHSARQAIGFSRVTWNETQQTISLPDGMAIDLSGINKGLLCDHFAVALNLHTQESAVINHGSSSWLAIGKADTALHTVAVRDPFQAEKIAFSVTLHPGQGLGIASSNGRMLNVGDKSLSHLIDPLSGQPVPLDRAAVVIADSAARADLLDTILCLLNPDDALKLIEQQPACAAAVWDGAQWRLSSRWPR
jgi:FAD:protein FMN transferase